MKKLILLLSLLPLLAIAQEQKKLNGVGNFKVGQTTTSVFDGQKIKKIDTKYSLNASLRTPKGVYMLTSSDLPNQNTYYYLGYKINDEISVNLELKFYNDTLYNVISNNIILLENTGINKLLQALKLAGYVKNTEDRSEVKEYQNAYGAKFEEKEFNFDYTYYTDDNIYARGNEHSFHSKINEVNFVYYLEITYTPIDDEIREIYKSQQEKKENENNNKLIEGL